MIDLKLRDGRQAAAGRHARDHPPALRARAEVRPAHARDELEDGARRRDAPARAGHARAGRARPGLQHVRATRRAVRSRRTCLDFGNGFAGRGADLNFAIKDLDPLLTQLAPVARNLSSSTTDLRGFLRGLARAAAVVAPAAETQAALSGNLDSTFSALGGRRDAVHPGLDHGRRPGARDGDPRPPADQRPFLANSADLFHRARSRASTRFADAAPDLADARRASARRCCSARRPSTRASRRRCNRVEALQHRPAGHARHQRPRDRSRDPRADDRVHHARADDLQLPRHCALRNASSLLSEGGSQRHAAALLDHRRADGPQQRGLAVVGARQRAGRSRTTSCTPTRTRSPPRPGSRKTCEAGNEKFIPGKDGHRQRPRQAPTTLHDNTAP